VPGPSAPLPWSRQVLLRTSPCRHSKRYELFQRRVIGAALNAGASRWASLLLPRPVRLQPLDDVVAAETAPHHWRRLIGAGEGYGLATYPWTPAPHADDRTTDASEVGDVLQCQCRRGHWVTGASSSRPGDLHKVVASSALERTVFDDKHPLSANTKVCIGYCWRRGITTNVCGRRAQSSEFRTC